MALKTLLLRKKLDKLAEKKAEIEEKREALKKRSSDAAEAIEELTEASTEDETKAVSDEVEEIEAEQKKLDEDGDALEKQIKELEEEIASLEAQKPVSTEPEPAKAERGEKSEMTIRTKFFGLTTEERSAFMAHEDTKKFLSDFRSVFGKERRAIAGAELAIPTHWEPLLKESIETSSKLLGAVNLKSVKGKDRQIIMGTYPEALWDEMGASLKELSLSFNDIEVDGYKVSGYFAVDNWVLEDNDVSLASEIITALGAAIAKALDKAVLYGTGTKMPLGIVTRLAQTAEPAGYSATARPWEDLSTTHIQQLTASKATGLELFKNLTLLTGTIKNNYSSAGLTWVMNSKTKTKVLAESLGVNSNAGIVAGMGDTMPVVGGAIKELDFVADNDIIVGYFDNYLLAQRAGTKIMSSEHALFFADKHATKGTARYDGQPVIPEAFAVINISNTAPTVSVDFAGA